MTFCHNSTAEHVYNVTQPIKSILQSFHLPNNVLHYPRVCNICLKLNKVLKDIHT